jgi:5-oxoprolinase (ATP-hydrolysing) subunit B
MTDLIIKKYGDHAYLIATADPVGLRRAALQLDGVEEAVPAAETVLVRVDPERFDEAALANLTPSLAVEAVADPITLTVHYDGPDLAAVATTAGCSIDEVVQRHTDASYVVAFCGFAPGFAYLRGLHLSLQQPRLDSPRTAVPAGAVGVGGEFTGVYPRASPGGWRILGRTEAPLWDLTRPQPSLLAPGTRVRFVAA